MVGRSVCFVIASLLFNTSIIVYQDNKVRSTRNRAITVTTPISSVSRSPTDAIPTIPDDYDADLS